MSTRRLRREKPRLKVFQSLEQDALEVLLLEPTGDADDTVPGLVVEAVLRVDATTASGIGQGGSGRFRSHRSISKVTERSAPVGSNSHAPHVSCDGSFRAIIRTAKCPRKPRSCTIRRIESASVALGRT